MIPDSLKSEVLRWCDAGLSQRSIARMSKIDQASLSRWLNGKTLSKHKRMRLWEIRTQAEIIVGNLRDLSSLRAKRGALDVQIQALESEIDSYIHFKTSPEAP